MTDEALVLAPEDVDGERGRGALGTYRIVEVGLEPGGRFESAFGALDAEFGAAGELERREVIERWLRDKGGGAAGYHLLAALDEAGELAATRDCHIRVDRARRCVVAYLAHVVVRPDHRRTGLSSLMRAAPLALARRALVEAALDGDILLAAEMEPVEPDKPETVVRLVAYGKVGFSIVSPESLPYCQPDFRDVAALGVEARPLPMLAVVRWVGHETEARLPTRLAEAYLENLYDVFGSHCRASDMQAPRAHAQVALARSGASVALLPPPKSLDDAAALAPVVRPAVLRHHLPLAAG